ncbi:DUF4190 domain-containing protein [Streptomyces sp. PA03-6a]|nr:DUF4190 domain-containing protein [Streptomyces sp. PA03-6a]
MDSQHPSYPSSLTPTPVPSQPSRPSLNKLAVVALVFGLLVFVPVVGMVVGAIALTQIKDTRERGKGLAVTGLVLSALSTAVIAVVLAGSAFTAFVTGVDEGVKERSRRRRTRRGTPRRDQPGLVGEGGAERGRPLRRQEAVPPSRTRRRNPASCSKRIARTGTSCHRRARPPGGHSTRSLVR